MMSDVGGFQFLQFLIQGDGVSSGLLGCLKGARNGFVYASRVRFAHTLVMHLLFRSLSLREMISNIGSLTLQHASRLAALAFIYKFIVLLLTWWIGQRRHWMAVPAGFAAGYSIFGKYDSLNQQIVLYLLSRAVTGVLTSANNRNILPNPLGQQAFPLLAAASWATVMYLFESDRNSSNRSLVASQVYIFERSNQWSSLWDFLPSFSQD